MVVKPGREHTDGAPALEDGQVPGPLGVERGTAQAAFGGVGHPVVQVIHRIGTLEERGRQGQRRARDDEGDADEEEQPGAQRASGQPEVAQLR